QIQAIECKGFEPFNVKTLHLISEKRLKTLAVIGLLRSSASPIIFVGWALPTTYVSADRVQSNSTPNSPKF
ncbi:hypothetical protein, partial [Chamaesiphon sp.]|uniref:hypothetical protein n=1 Tax=Chamaesiphon sp. TaxID=2814140 RepID=UPI0035937D64